MKNQKRQARKKKQTPIKPKTNMPKTRVCWFTPQHGTCPGVWLTCPVILHCENKHSFSWQVLPMVSWLGVGLCPLPFLSIGISSGLNLCWACSCCHSQVFYFLFPVLQGAPEAPARLTLKICAAVSLCFHIYMQHLTKICH